MTQPAYRRGPPIQGSPRRFPLVSEAEGPAAPPWVVERWFGTPTTLDELSGRVVVLHAFQMLCPGCVLHGVPQAARIHASFHRDDVAVVGLHTVFEHHAAMTPTSLAAFLHEFRVPYPVGVDAPSSTGALPTTMRLYGFRGTPSLVLIDRRGRIRADLFGRPDDLAVGAAIAALVAEPGDPSTAGGSTDPGDCDASGCRATHSTTEGELR
ncbi:MAG: TlpA family protein disulfide reductase [Myxococcales bacterium]|nr:TlpA family protein disulfide reductase [Myxococcales bacterium]